MTINQKVLTSLVDLAQNKTDVTSLVDLAQSDRTDKVLTSLVAKYLPWI